MYNNRQDKRHKHKIKKQTGQKNTAVALYKGHFSIRRRVASSHGVQLEMGTNIQPTRLLSTTIHVDLGLSDGLF